MWSCSRSCSHKICMEQYFHSRSRYLHCLLLYLSHPFLTMICLLFAAVSLSYCHLYFSLLYLKIKVHCQSIGGQPIFKNGPSSVSSAFSFVFLSKHYNYYNKYIWKHVHPVYCWDSNPKPSELESTPTTTIPALLTKFESQFMHFKVSTKLASSFTNAKHF